MNYELTHDTIAKQVYQKASTEARTRRKVERYISEKFEAYGLRNAQLTQDDIDYVWPYLDAVNCEEEEIDFIRKGKQKLIRSRRIRRVILLSVTAAFAVLAIWALFQRNQAQEKEQQSKSMRIGLASKYALYEGNPTLAFRLAEQTLDWNNDPDAVAIANEVLEEIQANPLVRDITHKAEITTMQFAQSGTTFFTGSKDGEARISNLSGEIIQSYQHASGVVWGEIISNDQILLVLTEKDSIGVYNTAKKDVYRFYAGGEVADIFHTTAINGIAAAIEHEIKFWDFDQGAEPIFTIQHEAKITSVAMAKIGAELQFFASDENGKAYRWNQNGEQTLTFDNYLDTIITDIAIDSAKTKLLFQTPVGDFMTAISGDTLDFTTAYLFHSYQPKHSKFSQSQNPDRVISISRDSNLVYVWNMGADDTDIDMQHSPKGFAQFACLSDNGKRTLVGSTDNETVVYVIKNDIKEQNQDLFRYSNQVDWGVFAPNHAHFLSSASTNEVLLWKLDQDYVDNKMNITLDQMRGYYESRIRPFTTEEQKKYDLVTKGD